MARGKMDQELLALGRASKHIEELDDPRAQSRVATYLMMRYTAAGEQNLPSEERAKHFGNEADPRQMTIPGTVAPATPDAAPTRPATPPDTATATTPATGRATAPEGPATGRGAVSADTSPTPDMRDIPPPVVTGWGLAGEDGGSDDEGAPPAPKTLPRFKREKPKAKEVQGGWDLAGGDEEVEVDI